MRAVLLDELVPWDGGSQRLCVRLARGIRVVSCTYRLLGRVWRKLQHDGATTTVFVPL
jgi:hypothetical protein